MSSWSKRPIIHEIYTRVWLPELGKSKRTPATLVRVPEAEWDAIVVCRLKPWSAFREMICRVASGDWWTLCPMRTEAVMVTR
jgi:hypothetical protein